MQRFFLLIMLITVAPAEMAGQAARLFEPFKLPVGPIECEARASLPEDLLPSATVLFFSEGEEMRDAREIEAGYTALGAPVWLTVLADESLGAAGRGWAVKPHGYLIKFDSSGSSQGLHVPGMWLRAPRETSGMGRGSAMSDADVALARRLAEHFWISRCGRTLGGP